MTTIMNHVYVVLDSMTVMHYKWFADYPWQKHDEFKGKKVIIVFVRPMIEELDKHKDTHKRGNVRKRCQKALGWIEKNLAGKRGEEVEVKPNLFARADFKDYPGHRAVRTDDRILEFAKERDASVTICSGDFTLRLMAQENGLKAVTPLVAQRITDDEDTELQEAQKELDVLKNRLPKLVPVAQNGAIEYAKLDLPFQPDTFHYERMVALTDGLHPPMMFTSSSKFPFYEMRPSPISTMHEYDANEVSAYQEQLGMKLAESVAMARRLCSSPIPDLKIRNEGTAPATQVDVTITAPPDCELVALDEFEFPDLPKRPRKRLDFLYDHSSLLSHLVNRGRIEAPPTFIVNGNQAVWHVKMMSHHKTFAVPDFAIVCSQDNPRDEYGLEVRITASELPNQVVVNIPVKIAPESEGEIKVKKWITDKLVRHFESSDEANKRMDAEDED